jgi:CBS domain-containing protein
MKVDRVFTRHVLATTRSAMLAEAAAAMSRYKVGALLVMDEDGPDRGPVGIVTDRDLAMRGFASIDATVGSAMTPVVATVREDADAHEALELMRAHGVRRLIVTDAGGQVCGFVSIDDLVDGLSADLAAAAEVLKGEIRRDSAGLGEVLVGGLKLH